MVERLVLAAAGGWAAPSARYRLGPLRNAGDFPIEVVSAGTFPSRDAVEAMLDLGGRGVALILQRALPSPADLDRLRARYTHLVFDVDDAIYTVPPDHSRRRFRRLSKQAARVLQR